MKIKNFVAVFIAMSITLSTFAIIPTYALDRNNSSEITLNDEVLLDQYSEYDFVINDSEKSDEYLPITIEQTENEDIILIPDEAELQPAMARSCEDSEETYSSSCMFASYRCSYYPNAARPYYLVHPSGRSLGIGDPTLFDLCEEYRLIIIAMTNAERHAKSLTRVLGFALDIGTILASQGLSYLAIKTMGESIFVGLAVDYLVSQAISPNVRDQIIEILLPNFADLQELMDDADRVFNNLYNICSNYGRHQKFQI